MLTEIDLDRNNAVPSRATSTERKRTTRTKQILC
jgi:hypothetical protein